MLVLVAEWSIPLALSARCLPSFCLQRLLASLQSPFLIPPYALAALPNPLHTTQVAHESTFLIFPSTLAYPFSSPLTTLTMALICLRHMASLVPILLVYPLFLSLPRYPNGDSCCWDLFLPSNHSLVLILWRLLAESRPTRARSVISVLWRCSPARRFKRVPAVLIFVFTLRTAAHFPTHDTLPLAGLSKPTHLKAGKHPLHSTRSYPYKLFPHTRTCKSRFLLASHQSFLSFRRTPSDDLGFE